MTYILYMLYILGNDVYNIKWVCSQLLLVINV